MVAGRHPWWGTIGLPLLAMLYVRQKNLKSIAPWYKVKFQTKLQQAVELVQWVVQSLYGMGKTLWIVADDAATPNVPFCGGRWRQARWWSVDCGRSGRGPLERAARRPIRRLLPTWLTTQCSTRIGSAYRTSGTSSRLAAGRLCVVREEIA